MRILVAGSSERQYTPTPDGLGQNHFHAACQLLGGALAEHGHQIVLLSDSDFHADRFVLAGYVAAAELGKKAVPKARVSYGSQLDPENSTSTSRKFNDQRSSDYVQFEDFNAEGDYPFNRVAILRDVDVFVAIGGSEGVKGLSEIAYAINVPIVPIPSFGGTAEQIYLRERRFLSEIVGAGDIAKLTVPFMSFSTEEAEIVVTAVEKLSRYSNTIADRKKMHTETIELQVRNYVSKADVARFLWFALQIFGLLAGFFTTVLLLLEWGEALDWKRQVVTILPSVGGFATTILITFGMQQVWAKREAAITEAKRLLAAVSRLPDNDLKRFEEEWRAIEARLIDLEEKQRSGTVDAIIQGARERARLHDDTGGTAPS